jgi:hypothetical protein
MNKNIVALMLGLGLGLGILTAEAGPRDQCSGQSDEFCITQDYECQKSGTPYKICDRQLTRCLSAALNCRG